MARENTTVRQSRGLNRKSTPPPKQTSSRWLWLVGGAGILLLIVLAVVLLGRDTGGEIAGVQRFSGVVQGHQEGPLTYPQIPPVGGVHNPAWQNCGIYEAPIANENAVHSLEHGAVWITYQPGLDADSIAALQTLVRGRRYALLSPYEGLSSPVVASAWGVQLKVAQADDPRLEQFLSAYLQGPQTPEPGATCTGGVGTPLER